MIGNKTFSFSKKIHDDTYQTLMAILNKIDLERNDGRSIVQEG